MRLHPFLLFLPLAITGCASPFAHHTSEPPENKQIREIVTEEAKAANASLHPKGLCIVVAEPTTGRIVAMHGSGDKKFLGGCGRSCWVMFEPGSTFKPVVVVAALEKGVITPKAKIFCENGLFSYGGKTIKDHYRAGDLTWDEILAKSSNIGASKMSLLLKDEDYYEYVRRFGFGEKTGISIPCETAGFLNPPSKWQALTKTRMAFGQSVAVTPIQLNMAYCALCNGGKLMRPLIDAEKPKVVRRVCSQKTADMVKNALAKVASPDGTAPLARVEGVSVGGKTGTAQAIGKNGVYLTDQYWTMFAGFFPVDHPKYVVTVVVDEAQLPPESNYGGLVAAPIFSKIAGRINELNQGHAARQSDSPNSATLGQSKALITRELGDPTAHYMNGFHVYKDINGNEVQAHYSGGKADALFYYTFDRKISESWLSSTLALNSNRSSWVLEASSPSGRRVYRTTDGKFHAFLSKGNQLLVDTDAFFQRSLHQSGKAIHVDNLPDCLFAPDHDLARIGVTEASVVRNYGQPIATAPDGAKEYDDGYQSVVVHYKNGRSDAVLYDTDNHGKFNDCWISCLLQLNSLNAWIVAENAKPNDVSFWTPKDDKVAHLIKGRSLIVYTQDYGSTRVKEDKVTDKKKTHFPASITPCGGIWLGETEAAMTKKLVPPTLEKQARVYRDGDLKISATFDDGICSKIIYRSSNKRKLNAHWISATLAVNSRGRCWFTYEGSSPRKTFYRTYDDKFYARLKNGTDLGIMTEAVFKKAEREVIKRKQATDRASK